MTSRITHEKQIDVIKSWCNMGTIETIKYELDLSWFECLNELELLPEGTQPTGRGIRCFGKDKHLCNSLSEKYIDDSNILEEKKLSKTDCVLIELLIDKSVVLVTNNTLLKEATTQEAKERNVKVNIFDPLEL